MNSCAKWQSSRVEEIHGLNWLLGWWSAANQLNAGYTGKPGTVGNSTDGMGVIGEVKLLCQQQPSLSLLDATSRVYRRFEDEGR
jgi:hypothetical protein